MKSTAVMITVIQTRVLLRLCSHFALTTSRFNVHRMTVAVSAAGQCCQISPRERQQCCQLLDQTNSEKHYYCPISPDNGARFPETPPRHFEVFLFLFHFQYFYFHCNNFSREIFADSQKEKVGYVGFEMALSLYQYFEGR